MIGALLFLILLVVAVYLIIKLTVAILKYLITNAVVGLILLWILNTIGGVTHVRYTPPSTSSSWPWAASLGFFCWLSSRGCSPCGFPPPPSDPPI